MINSEYCAAPEKGTMLIGEGGGIIKHRGIDTNRNLDIIEILQ